MNHTFTKFLISFFLKRNIFLSLAFLCFGIAAFLYVVIGDGISKTFEEKYLFDVQNKVSQEIMQSNSDLDKVFGTITNAKSNRFSAFRTTTAYPYFVFRNGKLIFWSDYQFVPDYTFIKGNYSTKALELETGKFILNKRWVTVGANTFEVFSMINLSYSKEYRGNGQKTVFNESIFKVDPKEISIIPASKVQHNIFTPSKTFLFSVFSDETDNSQHHIIPDAVIIVGFLCLLFSIIYLFTWIWYFNNSHQYGLAFMILVAFFLLLRVAMLFCSIPFIFSESELFNPKYFSVSIFSPSLGDLIINLLVLVFILFYLINYFYKMSVYLWLMNLEKPIKRIISVVLLIGSFGVSQLMYSVLLDIYQKSNNELSLALNIDIWEKPLVFYSLLIYVLISLGYFLICHFLIILVIKLNRQHTKWVYQALLLAFVFASLVCFIFSNFNIVVFGIHAVYVLVLFFTSFPRYLYTFRYQTSIYFFCGALVCAGIGNYVVSQQNVEEDFTQKKQFAKSYFDENDEKAEFLLSKASLVISRDSIVMNLLKSDFLPKEQVENYIKHNLLDSYFSYYDVNVFVFDYTGKSLDNTDEIENYETFEKIFKLPKYQTKNANVYFVNDLEVYSGKQYFNFIPLLNKEDLVTGYIILDLKKKKEFTESSTDGESPIISGNKLKANTYSFAIYENGKIVKTGGEGFNYESKLSNETLLGKEIIEEGVEENGYKHVGFIGKNGRAIVVSSETQSIASIYANFSFLFLILVFTIIVVILFYASQYGLSKMNINIASKIQIYLNIAFLLPLILVVSITFSIIGTKFSESQENSYLNQTESIGINLMPAVDRYIQGKMSKQFLSDTINSIAVSTKKYISVFDTKGHLLASNKPLSFEQGFISSYINPIAYTQLMEEKEKKVILDEAIGDLSFKTSYLELKSNEGKLLGIVCIPFYDSKTYFTKEVSSVIGSLLNTFTTIFLVLLWFSYLASNLLVVPLQMITNKLRKIDLSKPSEPLSWRSDDEIGVLVKAYNEMLVKLDESKVALTDANKQSAWQQMAKQVAHEIKNPLTPMKLSLQLLLRKISRGTELDMSQVKDQIESLTGQIDNLSYIATSFSDFARLPIPKSEVFDFAYETRKVVNLFKDDTQQHIRMMVPVKAIKVVGDRQLTGNIIKNLIMNAIQSIPESRNAEVIIAVEVGLEAVTFSIQDNGIGIPEENQGKIFMLDYSTKVQGSGVGLALAKWVVDNAKGSIWFETVENEGTKFFFTLPLAL